MAANLFQELKDALQDFKNFLDPKVDTLAPAIQAVAAMIPQITELLDQLIGLLGALKTEIQNLNPGSVGTALADVTTFTTKVKETLVTAKSLLPDQAATIDQVMGVADVVTSLPSIDAVKTEIIDLLDDLVANLNELKPA